MIEALLDTDTSIYAIAGRFPLMRARLAKRAPGSVGISAITFAELAVGVVCGKMPDQRVLEAFVRAIPVVEFDKAAARAYADLPLRRARFDRLLAAHAVSIGAILVTNNTRDFADIPGLRIENWTQ